MFGDGLVTPRVAADVTHDAVVVIPGIMGSQLVETSTGRPLWGLDDMGWYVRAWGASGSSLKVLRLSTAERDALAEPYRRRRTDPRLARIQPTGLLHTAPAVAPVLGGIEPYRRLVRTVRTGVAHPDAVLAFAYDWRLPVEHNALLLAEAAAAHLASWHARPEHERARRALGASLPARLVLVAHSMGGMLARCLPLLEETPAEEKAGFRVGEQIRAVVTLGTPFAGAAKAAVLLNSGCGAPVPLPRRRLRALAATLPGVHDLLPSYPCVDETDTVRRLTPEDVTRLGGDADLAAAAFTLHDRIAQVDLPGHRAVIGFRQHTAQTLRLLRDGVHVQEQYLSFRFHSDGQLVRDDDGIPVRVDRGGDATVPRCSAEHGTHHPTPVTQQHGALASASEGIGFALGVVTEEERLGPALGQTRIGLSVPDVVAAGAAWDLTVTGADPWTATCRLYDAATGRQVDQVELERRDGQVGATVTVPVAGVYRAEVDGGGSSPVTQLVMALDPHDSRIGWAGDEDDWPDSGD